MEAIKIDRTKLVTPANYAKEQGVERQTVYNRIKSKEYNSIKIDGVVFVLRK